MKNATVFSTNVYFNIKFALIYLNLIIYIVIKFFWLNVKRTYLGSVGDSDLHINTLFLSKI